MKNLLIITTALSLLSACGATTGGLQNAVAQKVASQAVTSAMASRNSGVVTPEAIETTAVETTIDAQSVTPVQVSKKCASIATKLAALDLEIDEANNVIVGANGSNVAGGLAASVATQGALHGGAAQVIGKVPFGGLFAKAAMDGMANSGKKKIAKAQRKIQKATLEKAKLEGMYAGKGCA